jgi:O-antigen ligase
VRTILVALVLGTLAVGIAYDGGFDAVPQWAFAATAAATGVVAFACDRIRAFALLRSTPMLALLAIAALQALSAAWTIGAPSAALRAGAVTAGYAALVVAAGVAAQPARRVAGAIAVAAGLTALSGLAAAAMYSTSFAERIEGGWRPEGPFGYPPALALVQVCALPALLAAMARARPAVAALAAAGAASAAGVLVLAVNRLSLGLAVLVLGIALAAPERTVGARRAVVAGAVALFLLAGVAFHELLGSWTPRHADTGAARAMALLAILVAAPAAWLLARQKLSNSLLLGNWGWITARRAVPVGAAVLAISVAAGLFSASALSARRFESHESFTHGRSWMWSAAYHAASDRPLQGYGAGSFLPATITRQPGHGRLTRFAHDLPLELAVELGIAGLLLALALYAVAVRALRRARGSPALWLLGPAVAAFLLSNLVDWTWHLAGAGAVFALALGGLLSRPPNPT